MSVSKTEIDLCKTYTWETSWVGCIIVQKTNILYTNQMGGYACDHPRVEGYYVPLESRLFNERGDPLENICSDEYRPECIEEFLEHNPGLGKLFKPLDSYKDTWGEAWVPVLTRKEQDVLPPGMMAIITYSNSD